VNRRNFLRNIGLVSGAMAIVPYISFAPLAKRLIHKVELPTFFILCGDDEDILKGKGTWIVGIVETYKGTLKELCDRYPNEDIFFYKEGKDKIGDKFVSYTRAFILKKERNLKVALKPTYEV
jgi:hypothetical protein